MLSHGERQVPIGLLLVVLIGGPLIALLRLIISWLPFHRQTNVRWQWALRRGFWNVFGRFKFEGSKAQTITVPRGAAKRIELIALQDRYRVCWTTRLCWWVFSLGRRRPPREIQIARVKVANRIPCDEKRQIHQWLMVFFTWFQVRIMYQWLSPIQKGLEPIAAEPYDALGTAYNKAHRALFEAPIIPLEYTGSIDLGALAVKGPYHGYVRRYEWDAAENESLNRDWNLQRIEQDGWKAEWNGACKDHLYEWNFEMLGAFPHWPELHNLGCRVLFVVHPPSRTLRAVAIRHSLENGTWKVSRVRNDASWPFAIRLALCAATNHFSLIQHFGGVHLCAGAHLAIATYNELYPDNVICRFLWPYIFHTHVSNYVVTRGQMVEHGDFPHIFSFTYQGMCDLFDAMYTAQPPDPLAYRFSVNDPERDAEVRRIGNEFDTPTQDDLRKYFGIFEQHARSYLQLFYNDEDRNRRLADDDAVCRWLRALNAGIPNGVDLPNDQVSVAAVARVLARFLLLVTVRHDMCGAFLWNYQSWPHVQPTRMYRNGQRVPLDVYQRLMNANFNLNVPRTALLRDDDLFIKLVQSPKRDEVIELLTQLQADLSALNTTWRTAEPWYVWRIYPNRLEANISE
ncbi:MAG TPA: hypothetical protein VFA38_02015 [Nitrospirales bacterium]|nr:hypothetical protein [Nitrospirales bacterium]